MTVQARLVTLLPGSFGGVAYILLKVLGVEFPRSVKVGSGVQLPHGAVGLVVHPKTVIGDNVTLYGGVTIGRSDTYYDATHGGTRTDPGLVNVHVGSGAIIGAGAEVLFSSTRGHISIGEGAVVGANAVVVDCDVPAYERWGGVPARRLG